MSIFLSKKTMEAPKKILVIDDDIDIIAVVETILKNEGYEVIVANGKSEAIQKALQFKPDLALCDVMMSSQYEGFELTEEFKKNPELKKIPVLIHTSMQVFSSPDPDALSFARHYRTEMGGHDLDVMFVESTATGKSGIDYKNEKGEIVWLPVDGFIRKPVKADNLLRKIKMLIK